ncbi:unnamed protein product [Mycena citricolor]|uniref:Uncharacterized protein n=1 Tax=Mycena citricolor TaxID=2018698 RepID=A0AAD2HM53_9AGAR|nr:unnamed protein product [Mycena citricolor]
MAMPRLRQNAVNISLSNSLPRSTRTFLSFRSVWTSASLSHAENASRTVSFRLFVKNTGNFMLVPPSEISIK